MRGCNLRNSQGNFTERSPRERSFLASCIDLHTFFQVHQKCSRFMHLQAHSARAQPLIASSSAPLRTRWCQRTLPARSARTRSMSLLQVTAFSPQKDSKNGYLTGAGVFWEHQPQCLTCLCVPSADSRYNGTHT